MSNNKSNSNNIKTKLTVMVAAIASVLLAGMGMNSAAYASILDNGFPGFNVDDIGQSAECVGVAIECRENSDNIKVKNNNNNNGNAGNGTNGNGGNGGVPVSDCVDCLTASLDAEQQTALATALGVDSLLEICADLNVDITPLQLVQALLDINVEVSVILTILECLDIEVTTAIALLLGLPI